MDKHVYLQQRALNRAGFPCGIEDGIPGRKFRLAMANYKSALPTILAQQELNALGYDCGQTDGLKGKKYHAACKKFMTTIREVPNKRKPADKPLLKHSEFPTPDSRSMQRFYGKPGDESQLVRIKFPYKMRLYSRSAPATLTGHRVHRKCAASLVAILQEILDTFGMEYIIEHGLDVFGGIFNNRSVRNGKAKSKHAHGAAIDLNPGENRNPQKWDARYVGKPGWANMPVAVVKIFEKHGWKHGGRAWGRDAMHFQATK